MTHNSSISKKVEREKQIVRDMILLYCRHNHGSKTLCDECKTLADYADSRTDHCPYILNKSFCSECATHCYKPQMREKIRQVMRYSGPLIILYHPLAALRHLYYTKIKKLYSNWIKR